MTDAAEAREISAACRWHVEGSEAPTMAQADRWFEITRGLSIPAAMTLRLCDTIDALSARLAQAEREVNEVGKWLGATNAPVDVIAAVERIAAVLGDTDG